MPRGPLYAWAIGRRAFRLIGELGRQTKVHVLLDAGEGLELYGEVLPELADQILNQQLGRRCAGGDAERSDALQPAEIQRLGAFDQVARGAGGLPDLAQAVGVRAVLRAHHQDQVDLSGERVVAIKGLEVDYSVFTLVRKGIVVDEIKLVEPTLRLARDANGWNVGRLVKEQRKEAEREGPARPIDLQSIEIAGGTLEIDQNGAASGYNLPERLDVERDEEPRGRIRAQRGTPEGSSRAARP